ncbi:MAG: glycosyltransferase family 1 protein [Bryobacterales bacterium]|nr:glycosyltransferase family 1 protein [Bryobacterales bacterium]
MNILFALIPEKGHVNPCVGPAQALAARGHRVVVAAPGDIGEQCAAAGLTFIDGLLPRLPSERPTHGAALVALIQDPPRLALWIEQLLLGGFAPQVELVRQCIQRVAADVVVIDPLYYPAALAAHSLNVPWASVSNSLNPVLPPRLESVLLQTLRGLAPRRASLFAGYGLHASFSGADVLSPFLNIAFTTEALCGAVPGVELVGPSFPLHRRGDEVPLLPLPPGRPIVYASFGSQIYHWPEIFSKLRAAAQSLNVFLVLAAGDLADTLAPDSNCHVYRYAPQREILSYAQVFVTHGGANSFMESIAAAVPMLLSPMCNDQFHQAYFLNRAGIGVHADLREMTVQEIARALAALLADGPQRQAVTRLARSYQGNGALLAAARIERLGR